MRIETSYLLKGLWLGFQAGTTFCAAAYAWWQHKNKKQKEVKE